MRRGGGVGRGNVLGDLPGPSSGKLLGAVGANHGGAGWRLIGDGISLHVGNITGRVAVALVQTACVAAAIVLDGAHSCRHHPNLQPVSSRFCA